MSSTKSRSSRRDFLKAAGVAAIGGTFGPVFARSSDKSGSAKPVLGEGAYQYEVTHNWGELPAHVKWGETHGVCIDEAGLIYITHRARSRTRVMDAVVVFDPNGKFVRSFGKEYHGGGHGIDVRKENGEEFLYITDANHGRVAKTTLKGDVVWTLGTPAKPEIFQQVDIKGRPTRYSPTNVAFGPDGILFIADGYGSNFIHKYDRDGKLLSYWGGTGSEAGKMSTAHGLHLDDRPGHEPSLIVADRANARLQFFTLDGKHLRFVKGVLFPAQIDTRGTVMVVPDLYGRVSLFDGNDSVITHLGYDADWTATVTEKDGKDFYLRQHPDKWPDGRFIHPHDAAFDRAGNLFVVEWVPTGRVSFLRHVS